MHRHVCRSAVQPLPSTAQIQLGGDLQWLLYNCVEIFRHCRKHENILFGTASTSRLSFIEKCIHTLSLRWDLLATPRTRLGAAQIRTRYFSPSLSIGSKQHQLWKIRVETINSATYAPKPLFLYAFWVETQQICKSCVKIFSAIFKL